MKFHRLVGALSLLVVLFSVAWCDSLADRLMPSVRFQGWVTLQYDCSDTLIRQMWRQRLYDLPKGVDGYTMVSYQVERSPSLKEAQQRVKVLNQKQRFSDYISQGYTATAIPWAVSGFQAVKFTVRGTAYNTSNGDIMQRADMYTFAVGAADWVIWLEVRQVIKAREQSQVDRAMDKAGGQAMADDLVATLLALWNGNHSTTAVPMLEVPTPPAETPVAPIETPKPPAETPKPPAETPKPSAETPKPPTETPKPPAETPKPPAETPKPPAETPKPSAETPKPPTETPKPPAETPKPPAETPKPPTETPKPPAETPKPPAETPKPPAETPKPQEDLTRPTEAPTDTPKPADNLWEPVEKGLTFPLPAGWTVTGKGPYLFTGMPTARMRLYSPEAYTTEADLKAALQDFAANQQEVSAKNFSKQAFNVDGAIGVQVHYLAYGGRMMHGYYFGKSGRLWRFEAEVTGNSLLAPDVVVQMLQAARMQ